MNLGNKGIVAVGMVLLDGIGSATEKIAEWLGDLPMPAHVDAKRMAELRERLGREPSTVDWRAGGGVSNLARAAGAIGLPVEVWGCVGDDADGASIAASLSRAGALPRLIDSRIPTGVFCSLACPDGARRIVVSPGAAPDIAHAAFPDDAFHRGWALFLDGLLAAEPDSIDSLAERARSEGMLVAMDLSTPGNVAARRETLLRFAARCDVIFANEAEFAAAFEGGGPDPADETAWVIKRGERGAALLRHGALIEEAPRERLSLRDDTGAGDAFAAGFLGAALEGLDGRESLRRGNATAAAALRNSLPNVQEFLRL